jgi:hypothetical protein
MRVRKELPRFLKFTCSSRIPLYMTSPNRLTPRMAYIRTMTKRRPPTLDIAGKLEKKVIKVLRRERFFLKKNSNLTMRKDLMIVVCGPKLSSSFIYVNIRPARDAITIMISKLFQGSLKYRHP